MDNPVFDIGIELLKAGAVAGVTLFIQRVVIPTVRGWQYGVPHLNDTSWQGFKPDDQLPSSTLKLNQIGEKITGTAERSTSRGVRTFKYNGYVRAGQLVLTWQEPTAASFILGALVLKLSGNLSELTGYSVYHNQDTGKIVHEARRYTREKKI